MVRITATAKNLRATTMTTKLWSLEPTPFSCAISNSSPCRAATNWTGELYRSRVYSSGNLPYREWSEVSKSESVCLEVSIGFRFLLKGKIGNLQGELSEFFLPLGDYSSLTIDCLVSQYNIELSSRLGYVVWFLSMYVMGSLAQLTNCSNTWVSIRRDLFEPHLPILRSWDDG